MTSKQRQRINKESAAKSTGPVTDDGKRAVSRNPLSHGLCSQNIEVLIPDPDERAKRLATWHDAFQPDDPAGTQHVIDAAMAQYKLEIASTAHDAVIIDQVTKHHNDWDDNQLQRRDDLVKLLADDPARSLRELSKFVAGAEWVRDAWVEIRAAFQANNCLNNHKLVNRALRLSGYHPDKLADAPSTDGFALMVLAYSCWDEESWHSDPDLIPSFEARLPGVWEGTTGLIRHPDEYPSHDRLAALIEERVAEWDAKVEAARGYESVEKACAGARAHVPLDTPGNKLLLRYTSMASSALNKAVSALEKAQRERVREAEKAEARSKAEEGRQRPLNAEEGASYVRIDGVPLKIEPIGEGRYHLTEVARVGNTARCRVGVNCDPPENGPPDGV